MINIKKIIPSLYNNISTHLTHQFNLVERYMCRLGCVQILFSRLQGRCSLRTSCQKYSCSFWKQYKYRYSHLFCLLVSFLPISLYFSYISSPHFYFLISHSSVSFLFSSFLLPLSPPFSFWFKIFSWWTNSTNKLYRIFLNSHFKTQTLIYWLNVYPLSLSIQYFLLVFVFHYTYIGDLTSLDNILPCLDDGPLESKRYNVDFLSH